MWRAVWWTSGVAALAFVAWVGSSWSMSEVSLSCAKTGESQSSFRCDDRIVHALGIWPLFGLGLLLTAPPMAAALAARMWVSWLAVAALVSLSIIGLANWSSYWGLLAFAAPLAVLGLLAATLQRVGPRPGSRHRDSAAAA
ncbi:hypothetical protein J3A74_003332 [Rhodococcus sp. PvP104]|nr:hypothetical protein [Rhodococcus sp. PvP104]